MTIRVLVSVEMITSAFVKRLDGERRNYQIQIAGNDPKLFIIVLAKLVWRWDYEMGSSCTVCDKIDWVKHYIKTQIQKGGDPPLNL